MKYLSPHVAIQAQSEAWLVFAFSEVSGCGTLKDTEGKSGFNQRTSLNHPDMAASCEFTLKPNSGRKPVKRVAIFPASTALAHHCCSSRPCEIVSILAALCVTALTALLGPRLTSEVLESSGPFVFHRTWPDNLAMQGILVWVIKTADQLQSELERRVSWQVIRSLLLHPFCTSLTFPY